MWSSNLFLFVFHPAVSHFFYEPGFSGSGSRVQGLGPGFKRGWCKATLLKSHFCMDVLLKMCCIFLELFLIRITSIAQEKREIKRLVKSKLCLFIILHIYIYLSTKSTVKKRKELHVQSIYFFVFKTCTMHYRSGRTEVFCAKALIETN